jgi:hypothetical protein
MFRLQLRDEHMKRDSELYDRAVRPVTLETIDRLFARF